MKKNILVKLGSILSLALLLCGSSLSAAAATKPINTQETTKEKIILSDLTLFYNPRCPHCEHVLKYLNDNNIQITIKDTSNPYNRKQLSDLGFSSIPVLQTGKENIVGSDAIINYIKKRAQR